MKRRELLGVAAAGLFMSTAAKAQVFSGVSPSASRVLMVGGVSLQTSQLALQRSRTARIREFAQLEAGEQAAVAAAFGTQPGSVPPSQEEAAMLEQLASLSGRQFDRMYIAGQIQGHRELLELNSANAQSGDDLVSRAVAIVSVPSIQTHLALLSRLHGMA